MLPRATFAAAVLAALVCAAARDANADLPVGVRSPPGRADDPAAALEKAHNAYVAHQYDEAEVRLRALLDPASGAHLDPDTAADARMYLGAVLLAEKKNGEAAKTFEDLLTDKPEYQPDPLRVSLDAIDALTDARARLRDKLAAMQAEKVKRAQEEKAKAEAERQKQALRLALLEKLAQTETVSEPHSRWLALVPFGVGQFQNGQPVLGWTLLLSEGLLAAGSGAGAAYTFYAVGQRNDALLRNDGTAAQYNDRAQSGAYVGDALAGGFALVALVGIVQAEIGFVPEKVTVRRRELPPLSLAPIVGPGGIGVAGRF